MFWVPLTHHHGAHKYKKKCSIVSSLEWASHV